MSKSLRNSLIISNTNANVFKVKDLEIDVFEKSKNLETKRKVIDEIAVLKINNQYKL